MDLQDYRREIDRLNREIADAISKRMNVVDEIGQLKKEKDLEIEDLDREEEVKQQFELLFEKQDLPTEKGREMAEFLIEMAKNREGEHLSR
jgi:chorismate mutase